MNRNFILSLINTVVTNSAPGLPWAATEQPLLNYNEYEFIPVEGMLFEGHS